MDMDCKAQSIKAWQILKKLSDKERHRVSVYVQGTLVDEMELSPIALQLLQKYTLGELNEEKFLEVLKNLIDQFININGEEKSRTFLNRIMLCAWINKWY